MKAIERCQAKASEYGAAVECDDYDLSAIAPYGMVWCANGGQRLFEPCASISQTWYVDAAKELIERMSLGVRADED